LIAANGQKIATRGSPVASKDGEKLAVEDVKTNAGSGFIEVDA
jgi:hypothetical protein